MINRHRKNGPLWYRLYRAVPAMVVLLTTPIQCIGTMGAVAFKDRIKAVRARVFFSMREYSIIIIMLFIFYTAILPSINPNVKLG